ncbi:thiosulfate sulfurtransferase GlpE [Salinicola sp. LHM]|uniref:thiosulfate sulfurtransferase GlpE n=1 Tax=Salinicola TaxID=404432 RepID=UPI0008DCCDDB|nr:MULTISPECIES: thiosulfate sulfurtransferase GlpE [Salinicola]MDF3918409.1 thiosulfate sulfurtransferase GlpE [Salinicola salarius]OHZ01920.1 thiosulfate sulfurtransferase [Salinicola sp. MIT1003]WQH32412.1 thiosulfate sulfurtransferase GlpE [Salinicola sp. LHM]
MTTPSFQHLDPATLAQWLSEGRSLQLVDIRDPLSFSQGHIPGSRHLDNTTVAELVDNTPSETPLVVVCYHGHSSQQAASWLAGQGFDEVYSLDGGFVDWAHRRPESVER